ncbi:hypothetical protein GCM10023161_51730 [Mycobacterium paraffinicum]|uniref:Mammalian cell entry protein n=1 Tax=Mycobacterium paraffinicum TaxID=53378 RepID=A0ABP8FAJ8_9MYCO
MFSNALNLPINAKVKLAGGRVRTAADHTFLQPPQVPVIPDPNIPGQIDVAPGPPPAPATPGPQP